MADGIPPRPHRGVLILVFGIVGLVMCLPLGIVAWIMGHMDGKAMDRGEIDPSGRSLTQAGKVLGIVSVCVHVLAIGFWLLFVAGIFLTARQ